MFGFMALVEAVEPIESHDAISLGLGVLSTWGVTGNANSGDVVEGASGHS